MTRLADAGAEVALFASNTPHIVFAEIEAAAPIPLVSIVRTARDEAAALGLRRLLLLGNRFLMRASVYAGEFALAGLEVVVPNDTDIAFVDRVYQTELIYGIVDDASRDGVRRVIDRVATGYAIDGVILGGTELPLLLPMASHGKYPLLDTSRIHVAGAIARCWP